MKTSEFWFKNEVAAQTPGMVEEVSGGMDVGGIGVGKVEKGGDTFLARSGCRAAADFADDGGAFVGSEVGG